MTPTLTPSQREAALSQFTDYVIANQRGFVVAFVVSRAMAEAVVGTNPHWYSAFHLSDLTKPLEIAA